MSSRRPVRLLSLLVAYTTLIAGSCSVLLILASADVRLEMALFGTLGIPAGIGWIVVGFPRILTSDRRPYASLMAVQVAGILLPLLFVPTVGIWIYSSPSMISILFGFSWILVWMASVILMYLFRCPRCSGPYLRYGFWLKAFQMKCSTCGIGPPIHRRITIP